MAFDLSKKENQLSVLAEEGVEFELKHPDTDEPLDAFIKVRGARSKTAERHVRKMINEQARVEAIRSRGKDKDKPRPIEESIEGMSEIAYVRVISWRGIEDQGVPYELTKENALALFERESWIRDQILEVSNNAERFLPE